MGMVQDAHYGCQYFFPGQPFPGHITIKSFSDLWEALAELKGVVKFR